MAGDRQEQQRDDATSGPVLTPTQARQGRPLHRMRYVLLASFVLTIAAFVAAFLIVTR